MTARAGAILRSMDTNPGKSSQLPAWIAAIALIVICAGGISALMGWIPSSTGKPPESVSVARIGKSAAAPAAKTTAAAPAVPATGAKAKCRQCGVIRSVRQKTAPRGEDSSYEVTVQFEDGTSRMIIEAALPPWIDGDLVRIVDGVIRLDS
jgi:hypothetical protein